MEIASHSRQAPHVRSGFQTAGLDLIPDVLIGQILDVGETVVDPLRDPFLDVEAQDLDPAPGGLDGQGKAHVAQSDDPEGQIVISGNRSTGS